MATKTSQTGRSRARARLLSLALAMACAGVAGHVSPARASRPVELAPEKSRVRPAHRRGVKRTGATTQKKHAARGTTRKSSNLRPRWKLPTALVNTMSGMAAAQTPDATAEVTKALRDAVRASVDHRVHGREDKTRLARSLLFSYQTLLDRYSRTVTRLANTLGTAEATRLVAAISELEPVARYTVMSELGKTRAQTRSGILRAAEQSVSNLLVRGGVWHQNVLRFAVAVRDAGFPLPAITLPDSRLATSAIELSRENLEAVIFYTQDRSQATRINRSARAGKDRQLVAALDEALSVLPPVSATVYRRAILRRSLVKRRYVPGTTITERQFLSTSLSAEFVDNRFGDIPALASDVSIRFEITSTTGRDVGAISRYADEQEVLFQTGTRFRVLEVQEMVPANRFEPQLIIRLEEVNPD